MLTNTPAAPPRLQLSPRDRRGVYRSAVQIDGYWKGKKPPNAGRRFPAEVLTSDEVYALMDACGRGHAGLRNRALIMMFWRCGLRCSEALGLYPKDVDLDRGLVTVLHGKGDKRRVVSFNTAAAAVFEKWERDRRALGLAGRQPYFCVISRPTTGAPLHSGQVRETLKELAERAGIEKRVHPHGLRHTYAAYLMDRGVPIHEIQAMLGHASLAVTERYVSHLNPAQVLQRMRELDWPEPPGPRSAGAAPPDFPSPARA